MNDISIGDLVSIKHYGIKGMFLVLETDWTDEDGWLARLLKVGTTTDIRGWMPLSLLEKVGQKMTETNTTNRL
jgi:hypothetical protein